MTGKRRSRIVEAYHKAEGSEEETQCEKMEFQDRRSAKISTRETREETGKYHEEEKGEENEQVEKGGEERAHSNRC